MRRILSCLLLIGSLLLVLPLAVSAEAAVVLGFSASSIQVGDSLIVTVKFSDSDSVGGVEATLSYDDSVLEFVSGNDANGAGGKVRIVGWSTQATAVKSLSYSLTFKAKAAGSALIRVDESAVYSFDSNLVGNPTAGARVTVTTKETLSGNADLSALKLSAGQLSPAFSASVTSYSVSVPNSVGSLTISATPADGKAKVAVSGNASLQVGSNKRVITVTAPNGTTKTYTVVITRQKADATTKPVTTTTTTTASSTTTTATESTVPADPEALRVEWNGKTYQIAETLEGISLPDGWTVTEYRYHGNAVQAAKGSSDGRLLFWMTDTADEDQNGAFFLYDTFTGKFYPYVSVAVSGGRYLLLQPEDGESVPAGCVAGTADIGGQTLTVWRWEAEELADFCLVYAINPAGETGLYRYDLVEGTLQRYADLPAGTTTTTDAAGALASTSPGGASTASQTEGRIFGVPVLWIPIAGLSLICILLGVLLTVTLRRSRPRPKH